MYRSNSEFEKFALYGKKHHICSKIVSDGYVFFLLLKYFLDFIFFAIFLCCKKMQKEKNLNILRIKL